MMMERINDNFYCRYNCFLCDFDLCDSCAKKEEGLLKRRASSVDSFNIVNSRRTSTDQQLHFSTIKSSRLSHTANITDLRRFSSISQMDQQPFHVTSSRKSSKSDEKCLLRSSSNIQQKFTDKKINSSLTNGSYSRRYSSQLFDKQTPEMIIHHEYKEGKIESEKKNVETKLEEIKKSNPSLIVVNVFVSDKEPKSDPPNMDNNEDDKNDSATPPAKAARRHSDAAILSQTPIYSGARRLSCFPTNNIDHHFLQNIVHSVEQVIAEKGVEKNGSQYM